jgi:flagellar biosynthesis protein FliR
MNPLWRELLPFAFAVARIAPVTFLCPLLGGAVAPPPVRLGVALSLAAFVVRFVPTATVPESLAGAVAALSLEALVGVGLGLAAAAPFDAARVGGRLLDLARGSSAEAALPHLGTRESASGDMLYQLLVAMAASGLVLPQIIAALARSFAVVPPGAASLSVLSLDEAVRVSGAVLATGLAIAAPVIVACLIVDAAVALAARVGPSFGLQEQLSGLRLMVGAVAFWVGVGGAASALLEHGLNEALLLARWAP